jgi:outer membrane lipoprotein-sorting protein
MKVLSPSFSAFLPIALVWSLLGSGSAPHPKPADAATLDSVLKKMDATAATFRNAQATLEWDIYQKVIDEIDEVDTGTIYYRRNGKDIEMMVDIKMAGSSLATLKPAPKYVLFNEGKIRVYQPVTDQVTVYDSGKNRAEFESYAVLGFGGSGQDLMKAFDVTYVGPETINGVATAKLQLIPKSDRVRNTFKQILLWIDLDKGISVQQQFFTPQNDYRLCKYSAIQLNDKKFPEDVFKLKTTSKTQTVAPHG